MPLGPYIFSMIKEVTGVKILTDKGHQVYKPSKGTLERLLKIGSHALPHPSQVPSSSHGLSHAGPSSSSGPPRSPRKKKGILNFISQGLFACFIVGCHNVEETRSHKQYVDEQLLKIETRQKELMPKQDIHTHRLGLLSIFLHRRYSTILGRKWEVPP